MTYIDVWCRKKYLDHQIIQANERRTSVYSMLCGLSSSWDFSVASLDIWFSFVSAHLGTPSYCLTLALRTIYSLRSLLVPGTW